MCLFGSNGRTRPPNHLRNSASRNSHFKPLPEWSGQSLATLLHRLLRRLAKAYLYSGGPRRQCQQRAEAASVGLSQVVSWAITSI